MKKSPALLVVLAALGAGGYLLATGERHPAAAPARAARSHAADGEVRALLYAQPFTLERPEIFWWRAERPSYQAGWLLVLEVDPARVQPSDRAEPVLYVGDTVAERVNHPFRSGRLVVLVPSTPGPDGAPALDLASAPVWFGAPELPERIDAAALASARAAAPAAQAFTPDEIAEARARSNPPIQVEQRADLDPILGELVREHGPEEPDLARGLCAPRTR